MCWLFPYWLTPNTCYSKIILKDALYVEIIIGDISWVVMHYAFLGLHGYAAHNRS